MTPKGINVLFQKKVQAVSVILLLSGLAGCGGNDVEVAATPAPTPAPAPAPAPAPVTLSEAATLTATQEVAETASLATGSATLSMTTVSGAITGSVTTTGLNATAAHIHLGAAGVNGPVIVGLVADPATAGKWNVPANAVLNKEQQDAYVAGNLYYNVHSAAFPGGEIRGQIGREVALARLSGVQEVDQNASTAVGLGVIAFDPDTKQADVTLTFRDLLPAAAHIHTAAIGANGPVTFPLGSPIATTYTLSKVALTDAQIADFRAKRMYFNIHTSSFPGGEIRGQIGYQVRIGSMSGAQENPSVTTTSTGRGFFAYDPETKNAFGQLTVSGFTPVAGHIHRGAVGVNGPVVLGFRQDPVVPQRWATNGLVPLADADALLFMSGGGYLNAHSVLFPGGEVRGQLGPNR